MSLEKKTDETFRERLRNNHIYKFAVDTAATVSFSIAAISPIEYLVLDLEPEEVVASRAAATVLNTATGRLYGLYRDLVFRKLGTDQESGAVKKYMSDLLSLYSFGLPMYAGILTFAGADPDQVIGGVGTMSLVLPFISRPIGWWMDKVRKFCGVKTAYEIENKIDE